MISRHGSMYVSVGWRSKRPFRGRFAAFFPSLEPFLHNYSRISIKDEGCVSKRSFCSSSNQANTSLTGSGLFPQHLHGRSHVGNSYQCSFSTKSANSMPTSNSERPPQTSSDLIKHFEEQISSGAIKRDEAQIQVVRKLAEIQVFC